MGSLEVLLFGNFQVVIHPEPGEVRLTRSAQALFAFLLLERKRMHPRDVLASQFWVDASEEHARGCLNTTLWRLRQVLESNGARPGAYLVINHMNEIGFNPASEYRLDVAEFEDTISPLLARPIEHVTLAEALALEQSLNLYRGDLLESFYEDWALRERERLRFLLLNGLAFLMRYYRSQAAFEKSLVCGQRILTLDPLREEIHREMIRLYLESGQRALAVRQYEFCCKALAEELNIPPMEETQALYHQVIAGQVPVTGQRPDRQSLAQLLAQLERTQRSINSAQEQIRQIMLAVQDLILKK